MIFTYPPSWDSRKSYHNGKGRHQKYLDLYLTGELKDKRVDRGKLSDIQRAYDVYCDFYDRGKFPITVENPVDYPGRDDFMDVRLKRGKWKRFYKELTWKLELSLDKVLSAIVSDYRHIVVMEEKKREQEEHRCILAQILKKREELQSAQDILKGGERDGREG